MRLVATATFLATPVGGGDGGGGGSGGGGGGGSGGGVSSLHAAAELERVSTLLRTAQDNLQTINTKLHAASTRLQGEQGLSEHIAGIPIKGMLLRRQQRFPFQWEATYFVVSWGLALVFSSEDFSAAPQKMLRLTGEGVAFAPLSASQAGGQAFAFTVVADVSRPPHPARPTETYQNRRALKGELLARKPASITGSGREGSERCG